MRWIGVLCAVAAIACGDRYTHTQRSAGGRTEPVRIDKKTGRTEVLTQQGGGSPRWVLVEEATPAASAAPPGALLPIPEAEAAKITSQCQFTKLPHSGRSIALLCTFTNNSTWSLASVDLLIGFDGFEQKYTMPGWVGKPPAPQIRPGGTETWWASPSFDEKGTGTYRFIGMSGYPPP